MTIRPGHAIVRHAGVEIAMPGRLAALYIALRHVAPAPTPVAVLGAVYLGRPATLTDDSTIRNAVMRLRRLLPEGAVVTMHGRGWRLEGGL